MEDFDSSDAFIHFLENEGAIEWVGMSDDGERVMRFIPEVLKEVAPEMYESIMEDINQTLLGLYQEGLVDIHYDSDLEPRFEISEKGKEVLKEMGYDMDGMGNEGFNF